MDFSFLWGAFTKQVCVGACERTEPWYMIIYFLLMARATVTVASQCA